MLAGKHSQKLSPALLLSRLDVLASASKRQHPHRAGSAHQVSAKSCNRTNPGNVRVLYSPPTPPQFTEFGWCLKHMSEETGTNQALRVPGQRTPSLRLGRLTPDSILHYFSHVFSCTGINTGRDFYIQARSEHRPLSGWGGGVKKGRL